VNVNAPTTAAKTIDDPVPPRVMTVVPWVRVTVQGVPDTRPVSENVMLAATWNVTFNVVLADRVRLPEPGVAR
jgi:hypothetical protein